MTFGRIKPNILAKCAFHPTLESLNIGYLLRRSNERAQKDQWELRKVRALRYPFECDFRNVAKNHTYSNLF